ncbi:MAG TPA: glycosyltransferase [Pyrinomonadaceae bacterium]|nr:glycosyltransferase [Pyrinomonadaceae bacterium]
MAAPEIAGAEPEARTEFGLQGARVLHVGKFYPPHRGGMETHLEALCGELKKQLSVEVIVASDDRRTREEVIDGVRVTRAGTKFDLAAAPVCPAMARAIRRSKADLVHLHHPNPAAMLAYLASGHRGALVITYHSDIIRQRALSKIFWPVLRQALGRADSIIVGSPDYLNTSPVLQKFRGKCRVIPFGISTESFERPNAIEVAKIRRRYGPLLVLGVGRLVYYKGFEYAIRAMKDVDAHLLIVGTGPLQHQLEQEAESCKITDRVTFLRDVEDIHSYYHAADVFVLPSIARSEAFGIVQLEAMACGKPVVNTSLDSGVPFVSPDGVSGLTVPPRDAGALARALKLLLDDSELSAGYGRAGRLRVKREFSLEAMTSRTLRLYQEILKSPTVPADSKETSL